MLNDSQIYEFGSFRLEPAEHLLLRDGVPVPLPGKAYRVLLVLVRRSGHLVEKSEIVSEVWGDTFVEEGNLSVAVSTVRKVLGDDRGSSRYIETIAKLGYRFLPDVVRLESPAPKHLVPSSPAPAEAAQTPSAFQALPVTINELPDVATLRAPATPAFAARWKLLLSCSLLAFICAAIAIAVKHRASAAGSSTAIHSMVILPFRVSGSDGSLPHVGLGVRDDLIERLNERDGIESPAAALIPDQSGKDPAATARTLGLDAALTGEIAIDHEQATVSATLFKANGEKVWTAQYHTPASQLSSIEDRVEEGLMKTIHPSGPRLEHTRDPIHDAEAYQLYVEGRYFWNKRTERGFHRSIELFQQAVLKDPTYADAYAGLADSYTLLASYGIEPAKEAYPNAKAAAIKAIQLNDSLAEAHTSRGMVALYYEWNWNEAGSEFRRAIQLNPNYSLAHTWNALFFAASGQMTEALQQAQRGKDLDPLSLMASTELGRVYYWDRQYDKAIVIYRSALELDPYFARTHTRLGMAYAAQGDYEAAIRELQAAKKLSSGDAYLDGLIGYSIAKAGNPAAARKILAEMTQRSQNNFVPAFSVALLCVGLGERDQAMNWLERAYEDRSTYMVYAGVDPLLDTLHGDPRFEDLMRRMNLAVHHA